MKTTQPLVSIVIPVYNGSDYIKEAIDSALAQTYKNLEVIVINDGSTDDGKTEEIALSYGDRIRYFHKQNGGVSTALNLGIANMNGEYFSWLSHDDKYSPEKIERQVKLLENIDDPRTIAICSTSQINKDSTLIENGQTLFNGNKDIAWYDALAWIFRKGTFNGCSLLIPKRAFEECGRFDERLRYAQDALMWMKFFLSKYKLAYDNSSDSLMRIHDRQLTQTGKALFREDSEKIANWLVPQLMAIPEKGRELLYLYAKRNAKMDNKNVVKFCMESTKEKSLFSLGQRIKLRMFSMYGVIRPWIRKVYYRLFKKVKTK